MHNSHPGKKYFPQSEGKQLLFTVALLDPLFSRRLL